MHGFRVTNCKSGKDRTGVSVSLEQCMLLVRNHDYPYSQSQMVLDELRRLFLVSTVHSLNAIIYLFILIDLVPEWMW